MDIKINEYRQQVENQKKDIWEKFIELKKAVISYKNDIIFALYGDVFDELALLMRDMENSEDEFAKRLNEILCKLGIKEIMPEKGDCFDCNFHVRGDRNDTGMTVIECVSRGWKYDDKTLLGAIVKTEIDEGESDE